jgi:hypothetical protein
MEQLCILAYLIKARDIPLSHKLTKAEQMPGGDFFFRGIHELPTGKLADAFGPDPEQLVLRGKRLGARRSDYGDASIEFEILPRIPVTFIVWGGDEEFAARGSILFDQTAADQIALDALQAAVNLAFKTLLAE